MREVYIRPDGVISMSAKVRSMAGRASSIGNNVRGIVNSLDWLSGAWNGAKDLAKGAADGMGSLLGGIEDFFKENQEGLLCGKNYYQILEE